MGVCGGGGEPFADRAAEETGKAYEGHGKRRRPRSRTPAGLPLAPPGRPAPRPIAQRRLQAPAGPIPRSSRRGLHHAATLSQHRAHPTISSPPTIPLRPATSPPSSRSPGRRQLPLQTWRVKTGLGHGAPGQIKKKKKQPFLKSARRWRCRRRGQLPRPHQPELQQRYQQNGGAAAAARLSARAGEELRAPRRARDAGKRRGRCFERPLCGVGERAAGSASRQRAGRKRSLRASPREEPEGDDGGARAPFPGVVGGRPVSHRLLPPHRATATLPVGRSLEDGRVGPRAPQ